MDELGKGNVEDLQRSLQTFEIFDYLVFLFMLLGCAIIGMYYAFCSKSVSGDVAADYLLGGRNMKVFPIGMSLIASYISGITLLGNPTETYFFGTAYVFVTIGIFIAGGVASHFYLPVLHDLKLSSTYEYLGKRFDKKVRLLGSFLCCLGLMSWLPIVLHVQALAFNQVTGINIHIIPPCVCIVCIFYTTVGGLRAVVWTDVIQTWMMYVGVLIVVVKGTFDVGGFSAVWERSRESGRLEFPSYDFDLTIRNSIWSVTLGAFTYWLQAGFINQSMMQRYLALPTLPKARQALWIYVWGHLIFIWSCCYSGLVIYTMYHDCDPVTTRLAQAKDQLFPLLVTDVLAGYPGLPGLFVSGIFSASLSSLSTGLNSISAVILEDFIKPFVPRKLSDTATSIIMKGVVVISGVLCVVLVFVVEKLGAVNQVAMSLSGVSDGPSLGLFTCGIFLPWVNEKGALFGTLIGLGVSGFVIWGAQNAIATGLLTFPTKPISIDGCNYWHNSTLPAVDPTAPSIGEEYIFPVFKMSFLFYVPLGALVTIVFALLISFLTRDKHSKVKDPMFFSPLIRRFLPVRQNTHLKPEDELIGIYDFKRKKGDTALRVSSSRHS